MEILVVDLTLEDQYQKISVDKFIELLNNDPDGPDGTFWGIRENGVYHIEIDRGVIKKIADQCAS